MNPWVAVGGLGAGLFAGLIAGALTAPGSPSAVVEVGPVPEAVQCERDRRVAERAQQQASARFEEAIAQFNRLQRHRAAHLGAQRPWPRDVPDALQPEAVREHLEQALDDTPGRVLEVDCSAYPCVGVMAWDHGDVADPEVLAGPDGTANMPGDMLAALREDGTAYDRLIFLETGRFLGEDSTETLHTITWVTPEDMRNSDRPPDPDVARRDGTPLDQAHGRMVSLADDRAAARGGP